MARSKSLWPFVCCHLFIVSICTFGSVNSIQLLNRNSPIGAALLGTMPRSNNTNVQSNKNDASSIMYFQQSFANQETQSTNDNSQPTAPSKHDSSDSIRNLDNRNLTSSETQHYYGYEPSWNDNPSYSTSINHGDDGGGYGGGQSKRNVHYPPMPMDVVNNGSQDDDSGDNSQNEDEVDYDDDDGDEADDEQSNDQESNRNANNQNNQDGDGTVNEEYNDEHAQKIIDEIDGDIHNQEQDNDFGPLDSDDDHDIDFDHENSASFSIPKIDTNHKGCKTVYKEISTVPAKISDFFKRRRRRSIPKPKHSSTSSSYMIARECHFTDDGKKKPKLPKPIQLSASHKQNREKQTIKLSEPNTNKANKSSIISTAGESRFVPINADMLSSPSMSGRFRDPYKLRYRFVPPPIAPLAADTNGFGLHRNGQQFHKYPYPHYHIYYNRKSQSVLNSDPVLPIKPPIHYSSFARPSESDLDDTLHSHSPVEIPRRRKARRAYPIPPPPPPMAPHDPVLYSMNDNSGWGMHGHESSPRRPKKYSYNYYHRDREPESESSHGYEDEVEEKPKVKRRRKKNAPTRERRKKKSAPLNDDDSYDDGGQGGGHNDDGDDYSVSYGGGNYNEYENSYDSEKDKDNDGQRGNGGGSGGEDYHDYGSSGQQEDDKEEEDYY